MSLIDTIKSIVALFPKPPVHTEKDRREAKRKIVARFATGNLSLQAGKYLTEKDINKRRERVLSHTF
ncbi:hypothetical protein LJC41_04690 [Desulfosarcina sp. OttesenSCG-928-G17]|nr:hypothetical protein [Desulfosarcina sp. OttesenSCG-928-G17]